MIYQKKQIQYFVLLAILSLTIVKGILYAENLVENDQEQLSENEPAELPIVVVIPSYNNINWYEKNLSSVLDQEYTNFRMLYINDCSPDGTGKAVIKYLEKKGVDFSVIDFDASFSTDIIEIAEEFIQLVNQEPHLCTVINNKNRCGALENLYRAIHSCYDDEIIASLDGDDWFYHKQVLKKLNQIYSSGEVWFTHGHFIEYPAMFISHLGKPIPQDIIKRNAIREWVHPSHLRTFYSWIFKEIKLEDLLWNGKFFPMAWDLAIMFPICEMAQERHAYIKEVNYVYNMQNSINDHKVNGNLQYSLDRYIRAKPRYSRFEKKEAEIIPVVETLSPLINIDTSDK